jgi:nitrogen regulatory protein PII
MLSKLIGVPYRFNKEVFVRVKKNNKIKKQYTLVGVRFVSNNTVEGDGNKKIISKLMKMNTFKYLNSKKVLFIFVNMMKLIKNLILIFQNNPRIWLKNIRENKSTYYIN